MDCPSMELERSALGPVTRSIVGGTVLYCTVQLYCTSTMHGSSQFSNIERFLMVGMGSQICGSTEIRDCMGHTLHRRHIITRNDITRRTHRDIISSDSILLIGVDLVGWRRQLRLPRVSRIEPGAVGRQLQLRLQLPKQPGGQSPRRKQSGLFRIWVRIWSWLVPES